MVNPQDRYQKLEKIGEGSCGVVFRCRCRETGRVVAVKKVNFSYDGTAIPFDAELPANEGAEPKKPRQSVFGAPAAVLREVSLLSSLKGHPNIVELHEVFVDTSARIFMVFEFVEKDLYHYINEHGKVHLRRCKLYTWQLLRALAYCHERRITHRDIKPQNLLVHPASDMLKLCDFSLARTIILQGGGAQTRRVASLWYRSPELFLGAEFLSTPMSSEIPAAAGPSLDIWSSACVVIEMLTAEAAFPGGSEIEMLFLHFQLLGTPSEETWPGVTTLPYWSDKFPDFTEIPGSFGLKVSSDDETALFLFSMLRCNPRERYSAKQLLSLAYWQDLDVSFIPQLPRETELATSMKRSLSPQKSTEHHKFKEVTQCRKVISSSSSRFEEVDFSHARTKRFKEHERTLDWFVHK